MNITKKLFLILIGIITLILLILLINFIVESPRFSFIDFSSNDFCIKKGFDTVSFYGHYSPKFEKVECVSCYGGECIYQEYNVTKDWRGILKEK